jgi:7,8-dihydroneopterin aldolase/epimerase/oxygenase
VNRDRIELRGLRAIGICGALPEERDRAQPLEIDLDAVVDLAPAGASDDLTKTVHYGVLTAALTGVVEKEQPQLLERLAERLAEVTLGFGGVTEVTVAVRKLRPPVPQQLETAGVRITRTR